MDGLEWLANAEYPGRFIAVGRSPGGQEVAFVYGITGRSPPSRSRMFTPVDPIIEAKGQPEHPEYTTVRTDPIIPLSPPPADAHLIYYTAFDIASEGVIVTNGAQTDLIGKTLLNYLPTTPLSPDFDALEDDQLLCPVAALGVAFAAPYKVQGKTPEDRVDLASFEPDSPNFTTRISALFDERAVAFALLEREDNGALVKRFYEHLLAPGQGHLVATYSGRNVPTGVAIPRFEHAPLPFKFPAGSPERIAEYFFELLGPKKETEHRQLVSPGADFRVGVVAGLWTPDEGYNYCIIDRRDGENEAPHVENIRGEF